MPFLNQRRECVPSPGFRKIASRVALAFLKSAARQIEFEIHVTCQPFSAFLPTTPLNCTLARFS